MTKTEMPETVYLGYSMASYASQRSPREPMTEYVRKDRTQAAVDVEGLRRELRENCSCIDHAPDDICFKCGVLRWAIDYITANYTIGRK